MRNHRFNPVRCPRCEGGGVVSDMHSFDASWLASDWEDYASICGLCKGSGYWHGRDGRPVDRGGQEHFPSRAALQEPTMDGTKFPEPAR